MSFRLTELLLARTTNTGKIKTDPRIGLWLRPGRDRCGYLWSQASDIDRLVPCVATDTREH